jgi:SPOR domain
VARNDLEIPLPAMAPSYRVSPRRREEMDPATRRLAVFAGIIGGSLLLLVGVWSFTGHHRGGVPVIEAEKRSVREKPADPGGLHVDGANDSILSGDTDAKQTMAPLPETPAPQDLKTQQAAANAAPPVPAQPVAQQAAPQQVAAAAPPPVTVRPEQQPLPPLRPHVTVAAPAHTAAAPAAPPAFASAMPRTATPAPARAMPPSQLGAAQPTSVNGAPVKGALVKGALVQLAAVHSEEAAMSEWQRLSHKYPDLLGNRQPEISKTEIGGKAYWRVRTSGFNDVAQATQFCDRIKTKGGGCSIASF